MKTLLLYLVTAIAEIVGCYLPLLWLRGQGSGWWLLPAAALSLATFAWLLTLWPVIVVTLNLSCCAPCSTGNSDAQLRCPSS